MSLLLSLWLTALASPAGLIAATTDDDNPAPAASGARTSAVRDHGVTLTTAQAAAADLRSTPLQAVVRESEFTSFGKVLDIQPLLDLRSRLRAARADGEIAAAALHLAEKNLHRLQALYQADIIANRELSQAEAQWQSDRTREEAARRHVEEIRREALHLWGETLARLALDGNAELLDSLAAHRRALLQVTLPAGLNPAQRGGAVHVGRDFDRNRAVRAELVSAAARTDELVQGETWFFEAPAEHLRAGMRVNVWAGEGIRRQGVALPAEAVVWHAGRPWVYRDDGDGRYTRLPVAADAAATHFADTDLTPGTRIVVTGAQTLLSEEYKGQIPDEDDANDNR